VKKPKPIKPQATEKAVEQEDELATFVEFLKNGGTVEGAWGEEVKAEGNDVDRYLRPRGGLAKEHYDAIVKVQPECAVIVAKAVIENMLWDMGHDIMDVDRAMKEIPEREWKDVVELDAFDDALKRILSIMVKLPPNTMDKRAPEEIKINPHGDWSLVVTSHGEYRLKRTARSLFAVMYAEHIKGRTTTEPYLSKEVGYSINRVDNIFRRCKAWASDNSKLVGPEPGEKGRYRINL